MPDPLTLLSAAGMLGSGLGMLFNKPKSFRETEYGRKLWELSQKGIDISPIISSVGKETATAAQQTKTALKGRLISQGMGGSIAGQRDIANIDVKRMEQLQKALKDIQMKNEQLKTQYALQYGQTATEYDLQRQAQTQGALSELFGTAGSLLYEKLSPQVDYSQLLQTEKGSNIPFIDWLMKLPKSKSNIIKEEKILPLGSSWTG